MNPLTPMSDQERISLYNINMVLKKKVSIRGLFIDPKLDFKKYHHENCMANSKENF